MTTAAQKTAARRNIKRARKVWQSMSPRARARTQPEGRSRAKPGAKHDGDFYHIEVRSRREFHTFRPQDVGKKGRIERVAGKRPSGSWDTQKWLIGKEHAHRVRDRLVADTADARNVLSVLAAPPKHISGDRFEAKPRPNVPEQEKPTTAQRRARTRNIRKAQAARHSRAA